MGFSLFLVKERPAIAPPCKSLKKRFETDSYYPLAKKNFQEYSY
jgi:hypothetical protein